VVTLHFLGKTAGFLEIDEIFTTSGKEITMARWLGSAHCAVANGQWAVGTEVCQCLPSSADAWQRPMGHKRTQHAG
jgi:hypothetical protein